jgi:1,2-diacylglycerol-3-alpha-glucose alpha-1,2-glucosyltransferase
MKVCLYGELTRMLRGSGIGSAIEHQKKALELNGVEVTTDHHEKFDVIDINTIGPRSAYVAQRVRWKGVPIVIHTHTTAEDLKDSFMFTTRLFPKVRQYLRYFYDQADLLISPTEYTKGVIRSYGVTHEIKVVSNGVDTEKFRFDEEARTKYRTKYDLNGIVPFTVGHVFKRKGVMEFLDIARDFPQTKFMWYGRLYKEITARDIKDAVKKAPPNVTFAGYVKDILAAYCSGDIFFFPSWCENQGISILEAAVCRRPILVRNLPTYDGWLEDGVNCLKATDNNGFIEQLRRMIEDMKLREKLSENAYAMSQEHNLKKIGAQLKATYESLI